MRARRTLFAIAAGAALQYFLDPERGTARRERAREQIEPVLRRGQQRVEEARSEQRSSSSDTDFSDRLSSNVASTGLSGSDMAASSMSGSGYSSTDTESTGLATPITPPGDLSSGGPTSTGAATPMMDVDDLTVTDVTVTETTITDSDFADESPYSDVTGSTTDIYTDTESPYMGSNDTYTDTMDAGAQGVPVADYELADRVRSQVLGRDEFDTAVVNLDAVNGVVTLRGELDSATSNDLEQAVREVDGVRDVINYLHTPGSVSPNEDDVRG